MINPRGNEVGGEGIHRIAREKIEMLKDRFWTSSNRQQHLLFGLHLFSNRVNPSCRFSSLVFVRCPFLLLLFLALALALLLLRR